MSAALTIPDSIRGPDGIEYIHTPGSWKHADGCLRAPFVPYVERAFRCHAHREELGEPADPTVAERYLRRAISRLWRIPDRLQHATLKGDQTPAVTAVKKYFIRDVDDDDDAGLECGALILAGPTGVGKTWAAIAAFLDTAINSDEHAAYYRAQDLARLFISDEGDETLEKCIKAGLLVLDDAGNEYQKPDGLCESFFEQLFVEREASNEGFVIVTSNLNDKRFRGWCGDRVWDRISGPWGQFMSLPGRSLRLKKGQAG